MLTEIILLMTTDAFDQSTKESYLILFVGINLVIVNRVF